MYQILTNSHFYWCR